jgi:hypothetical protein
MAGNDTNSTLLCHFNGQDGGKEIVDDGNTGHIVTLNGSAQTSTVAKTIGNCSLLLNGTTDYLTIPDHADWDFGTGNFTIDTWIRFDDVTTNGKAQVCDIGDYSTTGVTVWWRQVDTNLYVRISGVNYTFSWNPSINTWYHLAVVRTGSSLLAFVGGSQIGSTASDSTNIACSANPTIGFSNGAGNYLDGYLDEFRISNSARWGANFTPSTIAYSSDSNTKLLLHMESHDTALGGVYGPATFVGTAQLDTAVKTFGTASLLLDGDSDYVTFPDNALWDIGTADYTVDARIRASSVAANFSLCDLGQQGSSDGLAIWWRQASTDVRVSHNGTIYTYSWTPSANTWYHLAVVRSNSTLMVFVDGTQIGSPQTANENIACSYTAKIGVIYSGGITNYLNGYIDELRISNKARWNANFTPPSAEYSADAPAPTGSTRRIFLIT